MKAGYIIILKFDNPASLIKLSSSDCNKNKNNNIEEKGLLYNKLIQKVEKHLFEIVLGTYSGKQVSAAKALGINRNTLKRKIDAMKIEIKKDRIQ